MAFKFTKLNISNAATTVGGFAFKKLTTEKGLSKPILSLDGDILTITDESGLAERFDIIVDGEVKETIEVDNGGGDIPEEPETPETPDQAQTLRIINANDLDYAVSFTMPIGMSFMNFVGSEYDKSGGDLTLTGSDDDIGYNEPAVSYKSYALLGRFNDSSTYASEEASGTYCYKGEVTSETLIDYLAYPYTFGSNLYGANFKNDTFKSLSTSKGTGAHHLFNLSIYDASVEMNNYGKLYCITNKTSDAIEVPQDAELYIKKGTNYAMSSQPFQVGDSAIMKVGIYDKANNTLVFSKRSSELVGGKYSSGTPSVSNTKYSLYALIDGVYRVVYLLVPYQSMVESTKLSDTAIGSVSRTTTSDGTQYIYTVAQNSTTTPADIDEIKQGAIVCERKTICQLSLYNDSSYSGARYVYAEPISNPVKYVAVN